MYFCICCLTADTLTAFSGLARAQRLKLLLCTRCRLRQMATSDCLNMSSVFLGGGGGTKMAEVAMESPLLSASMKLLTLLKLSLLARDLERLAHLLKCLNTECLPTCSALLMSMRFLLSLSPSRMRSLWPRDSSNISLAANRSWSLSWIIPSNSCFRSSISFIFSSRAFS